MAVQDGGTEEEGKEMRGKELKGEIYENRTFISGKGSRS